MSGPPDFDALYRADSDPWQVGTSPYERRKRAVVVASLRRDAYAVAWDPACGTGHLTAGLAGRCDVIMASDASPTAVEITRARCAGLAVSVDERALPVAPEDSSSPDLIMLSEVFYYLSDHDRSATIAMINNRAADDSEVVCVHWSGAPADAWLSGPAAQQELVSQLTELGWMQRVHHRDDGFLLDTMTRGSA